MNNKTYLILYKNDGKFYNAYNMDAHILNYYFNYKIIKSKCGFPDTALNKVINKLEEEKISYQIIYINENPKVIDFNELNRYKKVTKLVSEKLELDDLLNIVKEKINNCNKEKLKELIGKINEWL